MPSTNGHSTESVRTLGGYDAYFAPPETPPAGGGEPFQVPDATRLLAQSGAAVPPADPPRATDVPRNPAPGADEPRPAPADGRAAPRPAETSGHDGQHPTPDSGRDEPPAAANSGYESARAAANTGYESQRAAADPVPDVPRSATVSGTNAPHPQAGFDEPTSWAPPPGPAHIIEPAGAQPDSGEPRAEIRRYSAPSRAQTAARRRAEYATAEPSLVPERIERAHEPAPRIEVLPATLTSMDLLADIAAANRAKLRSTTGVRGALNKVGFRLGLSPAEQRVEARRARIRRQLTSTYQIAVVSVKGGVGRTTAAAALGSTFAALRPDRVVAIDANPDFGDLATRTSRHPYGLTLRDLADAPDLDAFSAVQSFTSINTADLAVLASPWTTEATDALSGHEYTTAVEVLRRHFNLLLVDCGTGVLDSASATVLRASDAVVVVTPATVGGVTGAVATLNWLGSHGLGRLVASSIVAIVHHQPAKPIVEVEAIEQLFATAQRPTRVLPYDAHLAEGGEIDLRLLQDETAAAFEELAAELADGFPGHRPGDQGGWR